MVHHPTSKCFILKDKIQVLVDVGILMLDSEQKKVTANMVTLNFRIFLRITIPDGLTLVPEARLEVINPLAEKQVAKGLIPLTTKSRKIMWVHPNIIKDEQWDLSQPRLKGKSCNVISLVQNDDMATIASLSSSEEEKFAFAAQPAASQPVGTWSGKHYL